jgi:spermidine synthase
VGSEVPGLIVFVSAFLMFTVELMVGKAALPRFGGTAAVWTTCLFFFQFVLLLGYGYTHALTQRLTPRAQRRVHLMLAAAVVLWLALKAWRWGGPLTPPSAFAAQIGVGPVLMFLALSVAAPLLLLTTTSPLIQEWVSRAGGRNPWRLYALSNAGSFAALIVYPLALEPFVGLTRQLYGWSAAFVAWSLVLALYSLRGPSTTAGVSPEKRPGSSWAQRLKWTLLSAAGTLFLTTTSNVMCQDVASAPMLWALPLGLYLLSFVITFEYERLFRPQLFVALWWVGLAAVGTTALLIPNVPLVQVVTAFSVLQLSANVLCHGALYGSRPEPALLSSFYVWTALGGALGSLSVSAIAPLVLNDYWEFPFALIATSAGVAWVLMRRPAPQRAAATTSLALAMAACGATLFTVSSMKLSVRNFFGVLRVQEENAPGELYHAFALRHGNITHGVQLTHPSQIDEPTAYYTRDSGIGVALRTMRRRRPALNVAVLGLGIGTIAALLEPDDRVDFYDIDENVISLAQGRGDFFHFLRRSKAHVGVKLGDARQLLQAELAQAPPKRDVLVVDVFSGDAVPTHLFTTEAYELYWQHLADDGLLALHISNRYLALERVALGIAHALGLHAGIVRTPGRDLASESTWVLVAKDSTVLDGIDAAESGRLDRSEVEPIVWTDDYQSIVPVLRLTEPAGRP